MHLPWLNLPMRFIIIFIKTLFRLGDSFILRSSDEDIPYIDIPYVCESCTTYLAGVTMETGRWTHCFRLKWGRNKELHSPHLLPCFISSHRARGRGCSTKQWSGSTLVVLAYGRGIKCTRVNNENKLHCHLSDSVGQSHKVLPALTTSENPLFLTPGVRAPSPEPSSVTVCWLCSDVVRYS